MYIPGFYALVSIVALGMPISLPIDDNGGSALAGSRAIYCGMFVS